MNALILEGDGRGVRRRVLGERLATTMSAECASMHAASSPSQRPKQSAPAAVRAAVVPSSDAATGGYLIRRGDTLSRLAIKFGTTVDVLAAANGISNPDLIFAGKTLQIPGAGQGASTGAMGAPTAPTASAPPAAPAAPPAPPAPASTPVRRMSGDSSTTGLNESAARPLDLAHQMGLKLISGKREQRDSLTSDHTRGDAIDMSNVTSGSAQGSPQMKAYAEDVRVRAKAGQLPEVKYLIYFDRIAGASNGWEWRSFTPAGDRSKTSPTERHLDHVHVSLR